MAELKTVVIPLSEFALPIPRTGHLEVRSGYGRAAAEGQKIHLRVQKKRAKSDPLYQAEVPVSTHFDRGDFRFRIDGRMDGIFRHETPHIEEIKSTFGLRDLARRLASGMFNHPYTLQLLTYGYIHWRDHGVMPKLGFHLVSSRTGETEDVEITLDVEAYEAWLELRLAELLVQARQAEKRAARRRKTAATLTFPFPAPRPGQIELMQTIEEGMGEGKPLLIQAPTGLGKTMGVIFPVLREAFGRGQLIVYVTPKNSQHSVAEDAVERLQEQGAKIKALTITAKGKICFKDEPLCTPDYCEYARDYYEKLHRHDVRSLLGKKRRLKARTFREIGRDCEVCPFELQIEAAEEADVIICDYNYVFGPRSALSRMTAMAVDQAGKPNLVIDEAHNLPARGMDYYSPALSSVVLEKMREEIRDLPAQLRDEAERLLDGCLRTIATCRTGASGRSQRIEPPLQDFAAQDLKLALFLSRYLESDVEIGASDPVLRLVYHWSDFVEALGLATDPEREEFFVTFHPHPTGGTVKVTCCDASTMLRDSYADYSHVIGFSATLKPFDYYVTLSGLDPGTVRTAEFSSPFPKEHRKLLVIPQVSTKYSDRERNYPRIAEAIRRITEIRPGNYFVFLPSFEFLDRVVELFTLPKGFEILRQERGMKNAQVEEILEKLRTTDAPTIVFAVQGGSFSEGVDYAGETVIGAFVVGPPLPNYDLEREGMREYYQKKYGAGFDYAYTIPAMAKAVQAAGRVIRSETDRGLIVLMDGRFVEPGYSRAMPADWFEEDVRELVSEGIIGEVADFWSR